MIIDQVLAEVGSVRTDSAVIWPFVTFSFRRRDENVQDNWRSFLVNVLFVYQYVCLESFLRRPAGVSASARSPLNASQWQTTRSAWRRSLRCDTAGVILHNQSAGSTADVSEVSADSLRIIDKASNLTGSPDPSDWSVHPLQRFRTTSCSRWVFFFKIKADGNRNQHS